MCSSIIWSLVKVCPLGTETARSFQLSEPADKVTTAPKGSSPQVQAMRHRTIWKMGWRCGLENRKCIRDPRGSVRKLSMSTITPTVSTSMKNSRSISLLQTLPLTPDLYILLLIGPHPCQPDSPNTPCPKRGSHPYPHTLLFSVNTHLHTLNGPIRTSCLARCLLQRQ